MRAKEGVVNDVLDVDPTALNANRHIQSETDVPSVQSFERGFVTLSREGHESRVVEPFGGTEILSAFPRRRRRASNEAQAGGAGRTFGQGAELLK